MMDRTWYDPLGDHAAKWNVKPKDSHEAVPAHLGPARTQGLGPFPRHAARHENKAVQRQDKHDCAQYDAEPPGEGPRQFRVHADGEGLLQRIDTFLDIKP